MTWPLPMQAARSNSIPDLGVPALAELRHAEVVRDLIEPAHQRRRDRNAVAPARFARGVAAFAGRGDTLDAWHPLGVSDIAHQRIDARLESCDVAERCDVDGRDRLAGVGDAVVIM